MSRIPRNPARSRLDPISYERLRQQILGRDGWRCQGCGAMSNLEVHHRKFRSHSGSDSEENLITLCAECHARTHRT
jgi:5-methylcytosine-specific restriction protein A